MVVARLNTRRNQSLVPAKQDKLQRFKMLVDYRVRHQMICEAAYLRAEKRHFENGDAVQDWLDAEREVDLKLGI